MQSAVNILALIEVMLIIAFMTLVAGVVVIRAILDVSIGLSLIIFLAQAYCSSPTHTPCHSNYSSQGYCEGREMNPKEFLVERVRMTDRGSRDKWRKVWPGSLKGASS